MLKLIKKITTTNISEVWEARLNGQRVIVKKPVEKDMVKILRFIKEARYWEEISKLNIQGVANVIEINEEEPWFAVEYIEGEILTDALRQATYREIAQRMLEVLRILEIVHTQGYLHLDIKPSNIMIDKYGDAILLDWGLAAKIFRKLQEDEYKFIGTPYYAPPELRDPEKYGTPDVRSDLYEVAATFYRIATKQVPFSSEEDIEEGRLRPFPSSVPEEVKRIITKAMNPIKEKRYSSARDMYKEIKEWLSEEKIILEGVHTIRFKKTLQITKNHDNNVSFISDSRKLHRNTISLISDSRFDINNEIYLDFDLKKRFKTKKIYHGTYLYHQGRRIGQIDLGYRNLLIVDFPWGEDIEYARKFFEFVKFLKDYRANILFKKGENCFNIAAARTLLKSEAPGCEIDIVLKSGCRRIHIRLREERGMDADLVPKISRTAMQVFFDIMGCDV